MKILPENVKHLRCIGCQQTSRSPNLWICPDCGPRVRMEVDFNEDSAIQCAEHFLQRPFDMWRYRELLPLPEDAELPSLTVGGSPISRAPRLAQSIDVAEVFIKDDGRNPSASLKDRASALAVVMAKASGAERVICASTGNAASSTACMAAHLGLHATIFVPRRAPAPKLAQLRVFGAEVLRVDADYDQTWDLCAEVAARNPDWFNRNCALNPYLVEGKKTVALELAEQLGDGMTDWVIASVGDGCTIAGIVKGLEEAQAMGLIERIPRVLGVQAEGAQPLVQAFARQRSFEPGPAESIADSICVGHPRNGEKALQALRRQDGAMVAVSDPAILQAMTQMAQGSGVFGEPAAAAAWAGAVAARASGLIRREDRLAIISSGNGLKDPETALKAVTGPTDVAADPDAISQALRLGDRS